MLESMWSSMSSSMQLAKECLESTEDEDKDSTVVEALDSMSETIENGESPRLSLID